MLIFLNHFLTQLENFKAEICEQDDRPFQSFSKGYTYNREGYKDELYAIARRRLNITEWDSESIGDGDILDCVIHAIEISRSDEGVNNNLLKWSQFGAHNILKEIKGDKRCSELEGLLYDFYTDELDGEDAMEPLIKLIGRRYPLISYLFFIKDCDRYLPISPKNFDSALEVLGSPLKTNRSCSWENYSTYLETITEVRDMLRAEGYSNTRLLDAHSFCWMIVDTPEGSSSGTVQVKDIQPAQFIQARDLSKPIEPNDSHDDFYPLDHTEKQPKVVDWASLAKQRDLIGQLSEELALKAEMQRLIDTGHPELANKVALISKDHRLGYDLHSFETSGEDRLIEVKTISNSSGQSEFYTSSRQLKLADKADNHFYYLVHNPRSQQPIIEPIIEPIRASEISPESKSPIVYKITLPAR
ncbi:MAG: DUF3883 domain-containing protein [Akkermansiaceae bacterium]